MPTWKSVIQQLDREKVEILKEQDEEADLLGCQFFFEKEEIYPTDALSIVYAKNILDSTKVVEGNFLVLADSSDKINTELQDICAEIKNCVLVKCVDDNFTIIDEIQRYFQVFYKVSDTLLQLQKMVKNNDGIKKMLDVLSGLLNISIDVMDPSFRCIAASDIPSEYDEIRKSNISLGNFCPTGLMELLKKSGELKKLFQLEHCMTIQNKYFYGWVAPLIAQNTKVGFLSVTDSPIEAEQRVRKEFLPYLPEFADVICMELCKTGFHTLNRGNYYNYIMASIVEGVPADVNELRSLLGVYGYQLQENMFLIAVQKNFEQMKDSAVMNSADYLKKLFFNSIYTVKDNYIYFLVSRKDIHGIFDRELEMWNQYFEANKLYGGITGPFYDFDDITVHIENIKLMIRYKKRRSEYGIICFHENQIETMLEKLSETGDLLQYCYPPLLELEKYDKRRNTELVKTLSVYLTDQDDIQKVCNILCIHKTTLYKRLERIKSIMNSEIKNADKIMRIQLSLQILNFEKVNR